MTILWIKTETIQVNDGLLRWNGGMIQQKEEKTGEKEQTEIHPGQHSEPSICNMGASCSFKDPENTQIHTFVKS